jgi:hypothetical protein
VLSTIGFFLVGGIGWFVTAFIGGPIRRFFDLRGEVIQQAVQYNNLMAVQKELPDGSVKRFQVSDEETKRLQNAVHSFSLLRVSNRYPRSEATARKHGNSWKNHWVFTSPKEGDRVG